MNKKSKIQVSEDQCVDPPKYQLGDHVIYSHLDKVRRGFIAGIFWTATYDRWDYQVSTTEEFLTLPVWSIVDTLGGN